MFLRSIRFFLAILALTLFWLSSSAPTAQAQAGSGISAPADGAAVAGVVSVHGVATHPTFRKWQLDLLPNGDEQQAHFLALGEQPMPTAGELAQFDTRRYPNGEHKLRLRVVYLGLNYDEYVTRIQINNSGAALPGLPVDAAYPGATPVADSVASSPTATPEPTPVAFRTDAPADGKRWIEIDIANQSLTAWQGDVPIFQTTVSTGKPGYHTLPGAFAVYRKYEETRMTGADYDTPDVPWTMYYSGGFAIHGAYWHDNFGTPVSHGCVNLRVPEAKVLFAWADVGTEVVVRK